LKILIIKLGALGDIITSTSIINQISRHHNKDEIYLLTGSNFNNLFSNFKNLNVFSLERKGMLNTIKTILWIRKQKFDRIYDLQSNDRTTIYCALSGSPFRAGNHPRFPYHAHPATKYFGECHSFDRLNQIIESANIKPADPLPFLPVPEHVVTEVSEWLNEHSLTNKPFVLLHAGSSPLHLKKRWPYFSDLASALSKTLNIIWIGGKDDIELNDSLSKKAGINATNAFSIIGLVELGKRAKFAVTNDSAPMHILSCSQIPVFGLFGPTYSRRTHALGQLNNVITAHDLIAENDHDFEPQNISNISLETVLNRLINQNLL
jgi:ADP-heptose:LPS heptosyltransferase